MLRIELDDLNLSRDEKVMLLELVKRKEKMEKYKFRRSLLSILSLGAAGLFTYFLFKVSKVPIQSAISYVTDSTPVSYFLVVSAGLLLSAKLFDDQYRKQKQKYEDLRKETIQFFDRDWKLKNRFHDREKLSERLASQDINIRYIH